MNDRARQIWREHAELLFDKYKETVQSNWRVLPTGYKWAVKVQCDAMCEKLQKQFFSVELLLGERLSDWTIPNMEVKTFLKLLPIEDRVTVKKMIENAYDDVGDCNGHIESELDYKDAIRIMEKS